MKRWKNLRDAFAKSVKKERESNTSGSNAIKKRKYVFNYELQFLKKIYEERETTESFNVEGDDNLEAQTDSILQLPSENTAVTSKKCFHSKTTKN